MSNINNNKPTLKYLLKRKLLTDIDLDKVKVRVLSQLPEQPSEYNSQLNNRNNTRINVENISEEEIKNMI